MALLINTDLIAEEGSAQFQVPTCGWCYELSSSDLLPFCYKGFVFWRNSSVFCVLCVHFFFLPSSFVPPIPLDLLDMWKRTLGIWFLPLVTCHDFYRILTWLSHVLICLLCELVLCLLVGNVKSVMAF